jgi:uncharacterized glyoxalase superfamily protein PhnB
MIKAITPITARAIIPSLKYDNALAAIDFLCTAFGFEEYAIYLEADRSVDYAQLKLGSNFVMLSSTSTDPVGPISLPQALAGATGGVHVILAHDADVDAHYARAQEAGAWIVRELRSLADGGRSYSASDCEGYVWTFTSRRLT